MTFVSLNKASENLHWKSEAKKINPKIDEEQEVIFFSQNSKGADSFKDDNYKLWYNLSDINSTMIQEAPKESRSIASLNAKVSIANRVLSSDDKQLAFGIHDLEETLKPAYDVAHHIITISSCRTPPDNLFANRNNDLYSYEVRKKFFRKSTISTYNLAEMYLLQFSQRHELNHSPEHNELDKNANVFSSSSIKLRMLRNSS